MKYKQVLRQNTKSRKEKYANEQFPNTKFRVAYANHNLNLRNLNPILTKCLITSISC